MPENGRPIQSRLGGRGSSRRPPPEPEPIELSVLHEDEWLIAVDKPPGMVVHPTYRNWSGTLVNALLWRLRSSGLEPRVVTRLDRDTSGVVLVALTSGMHAALQRESAAGRVQKEYIAVVCGVPHPAKGS